MNPTIFTIYSRSNRSFQSAAQLFAISTGVWLSACASLPASGPRSAEIRDEYQPHAATHPFELVDVSANTMQVLKHRRDPTLAAHFGDEAAMPEIVIGRGDGLSVNIWEVGSDPLFSSSPAATPQIASVNSARGAVIPEQIVGSDGCISIPFAGRVEVAGHTTLEIQHAIEQALAGKAQKPQVLVTLTRNSSSTVTVVGEVTAGARIPLSSYGERLLDVLAAAGGIRVPSYETRVQLTRGDNSITVPLLQVLHDPAENIHLRPGDNLAITRQPETYTAFGATGHNAQINFDAAQVSLTEAVAKAGGLMDSRADPRGVFLFRFEPKEVADNLGPSPSGLADDEPVPVVYRLDFTRAGSYFLAQNFDLRDHDILYVSNSPSTELEKFLTLVGLATQPVTNGAALNYYVK